MHDPRPISGPGASPSLLDLVCVVALTALLYWGALAVADIARGGAPDHAVPAAPAH